MCIYRRLKSETLAGKIQLSAICVEFHCSRIQIISISTPPNLGWCKWYWRQRKTTLSARPRYEMPPPFNRLGVAQEKQRVVKSRTVETQRCCPKKCPRYFHDCREIGNADCNRKRTVYRVGSGWQHRTIKCSDHRLDNDSRGKIC